MIPYQSNAKNRPTVFSRVLDKGRVRIEEAVGKLKRFKRVALRYDETAESCSALVAFACGLVSAKSVRTA